MNPLIGTRLLFHHARAMSLKASASLVNLLPIKAPLVAPVLAGQIHSPSILHLRLAEPIDELMDHIPLGTWAKHPSKALQQLRERGYLHDGISGNLLRFSVLDRTVPPKPMHCYTVHYRNSFLGLWGFRGDRAGAIAELRPFYAPHPGTPAEWAYNRWVVSLRYRHMLTLPEASGSFFRASGRLAGAALLRSWEAKMNRKQAASAFNFASSVASGQAV